MYTAHKLQAHIVTKACNTVALLKNSITFADHDKAVQILSQLHDPKKLTLGQLTKGRWLRGDTYNTVTLLRNSFIFLDSRATMVAVGPVQDPAESSFGNVTSRLKGRRLVGVVNTAALSHLQQNGQNYVAYSWRPLFTDETSRRQTAMGDVYGNGGGDSDKGQSQFLAQEQVQHSERGECSGCGQTGPYGTLCSRCEDQGWVFD